MIKLGKTKSYYLGDLSNEQFSKINELLVNDKEAKWKSVILEDIKNLYLYFSKNAGWCTIEDECNNREVVNALELFYTLENVQVDCRELSEEQIKSMCKVYESNGYKLWDGAIPLDVKNSFNYFRLHTDDTNMYLVDEISENKHTITYDKLMELFSKEEESILTEIMKDEYKPIFCDEVKAAFETGVKLSESLKLQPHYDNSNGSLYKICDKLGLNSYEFDIIKRVVRCRKKGQFAEDLKKTKDLIDLYLLENEQSTK